MVVVVYEAVCHRRETTLRDPVTLSPRLFLEDWRLSPSHSRLHDQVADIELGGEDGLRNNTHVFA